jgi:hypothetical protein
MPQNSFTKGPFEISGLGALPLENVQPPQMVAYPNSPQQNQINFGLTTLWLNYTPPFELWMLVNKNNPSISNPTPVHWIQLYPNSSSGPILTKYTVTTNNDTPTPIFSMAVPAGTGLTLNATVAALRDDLTAGLYGFAVFGARNPGGGAQLIDIPLISFGDDALGAPALDAGVNGDNIELLVTGEGFTTWNWSAVIYFVTQP